MWRGFVILCEAVYLGIGFSKMNSIVGGRVSGNDFCGQKWEGGYNRFFGGRGSDLLSCLIDSVVCSEADVARDRDKSDLGVD